jgi:hypothetical protein
MGEAKRRRQANPEFTDNRHPVVRAMFATEGNPINVGLVGSGVIFACVMNGNFPFGVPGPEAAAMRRAFGLWDRIRTGELEPWPCALCGAQHAGLDDLSCTEHGQEEPAGSGRSGTKAGVGYMAVAADRRVFRTIRVRWRRGSRAAAAGSSACTS